MLSLSKWKSAEPVGQTNNQPPTNAILAAKATKAHIEQRYQLAMLAQRHFIFQHDLVPMLCWR